MLYVVGPLQTSAKQCYLGIFCIVMADTMRGPEEDDLSNKTLCSSTDALRPQTSPVYEAVQADVEINLTAIASESRLGMHDSDAPGDAHFKRSRSVRDVGYQRRSANRKNIGIVIGDFNGLYADELTLKLGDRIQIISKDTVVSRNIGWWTGRNGMGRIGIFPAACVKVVSSAVDTEDTDSSQPAEGDKVPLEINFEDVKLGEIIGMGGFGKVHKASYKGRDVAVKVARNTTYDAVRAITEVLSEAEKFAHLSHRNICILVGVCLVKDICLVMEYAKGGPLSKILHEKSLSLPVDVILDWGKQIADGMEYLHHEAKPPLIHRDLKSSNSKSLVTINRLLCNVVSISGSLCLFVPLSFLIVNKLNSCLHQ